MRVVWCLKENISSRCNVRRHNNTRCLLMPLRKQCAAVFLSLICLRRPQLGGLTLPLREEWRGHPSYLWGRGHVTYTLLTCSFVRVLGQLGTRFGYEGAQRGEDIPCEAPEAHLPDVGGGDWQEGAEGGGLLVLRAGSGAGQDRGEGREVVRRRGEAAKGCSVPRVEVCGWGLRSGRVVGDGREVWQGVKGGVRGGRRGAAAVRGLVAFRSKGRRVLNLGGVVGGVRQVVGGMEYLMWCGRAGKDGRESVFH